ncbi:pentapeptide repeat-containing protein [Nakamurella sp. YIM 132084]|uniref:Pentapeptide repeat-containing protein n=2 Tax=Nakamurella leprariae TaxID=2803911 RepID=A0A938YHR2_9ACTN|nr:pentapeptide repeat-containing protein [Nakamurella leprariae]
MGGFAFDKDAGEPCRNLQEDFGCGIHAQLRERGFPGCTVFDCQGAGQKVTQLTFAGRDWRDEDADREFMFATFHVMRPLHELLWYVVDALARPAASALHTELDRAYEHIDALTRRSAEEIMRSDLTGERERVREVLIRASALVRAGVRTGRRPTRAGRRAQPGADLMGADLSGQDLRGVDLRGARLIAADLRGCDLREADLIGADLRNTDLSDADLSTALYLTQMQVNAARGSRATRLPSRLRRPSHWS